MPLPGPFRFGRTSTKQLDTVEPELRRVLERAIEIVDFSVIEGRRTIETQIGYLRKGVNPWPLETDPPEVREKKKHRFYFLQGILYAIARAEGIDVRLGVDWDSDLDFFDQSFDDLGHIELALDRAKPKVPEELEADVKGALQL